MEARIKLPSLLFLHIGKTTTLRKFVVIIQQAQPIMKPGSKATEEHTCGAGHGKAPVLLQLIPQSRQ